MSNLEQLLEGAEAMITSELVKASNKLSISRNTFTKRNHGIWLKTKVSEQIIVSFCKDI